MLGIQRKIETIRKFPFEQAAEPTIAVGRDRIGTKRRILPELSAVPFRIKARGGEFRDRKFTLYAVAGVDGEAARDQAVVDDGALRRRGQLQARKDRKSTRLNSSH